MEFLTLNMHQKSVYLTIFNATMISRSVAKTLKTRERLANFKISVFRELDDLTTLMHRRELTDDRILQSIRSLSESFRISIGQAQKPINVLLKNHFFLTRNESDEIKEILHCPLDSVILSELRKKGVAQGLQLSLTGMDEEKYLELQEAIKGLGSSRIEFDNQWDERHLRDEGL